MASSKEEKLDQVRKLIAKADSTNFPAERDALLQKADQIMLSYAIESWELEMAKPADQREKPELREFDYGTTGDDSVDRDLSTLFYSFARHLRCKLGFYGWQKSKVVGYASDLDFLDIMFTSVRLHLAANMVPHADAALSYDENLALLKEAGFKWQRVYEEMIKVFPDRFPLGEVTGTDAFLSSRRRWEDMYPDTPFDQGSMIVSNYPRYLKVGDRYFKAEMPRPIGVRFTKEYTDFCKREGRERVYSDPTAFRRNFVEAYVYRIDKRLQDMRAAGEEATVGKGLVLASREGDLDEFFFEMFPDRKPHPADCDCDSCHRCHDPKCQRPRCVAARKPMRVRRVQERKVDIVARERGRAAADKVDLSSGRNSVGGNKRAIGG